MPERLLGNERWPQSTVPRWKRPLDIAVMLATLPVWLPVAIAICLWIPLVSKGGILFYQERIGRGGRRFIIFKFRTMKQGADTNVHDQYLKSLMQGNGPMTKLDGHDSRLIPGGRLIRAAGLDELPQLLNVLRGEMSVVGPRPCTVAEMEKYKPAYYRRFAGLPGLTGSWQVNGKNKTSFRRMIALDIRYVQTATIRRDLTIIVRTVPTLLGQIGELAKKFRPSAADRESTASPRFPEHVPDLRRQPPSGKPAKKNLPTPVFETTRQLFARKTQRLTEIASHHTERIRVKTQRLTEIASHQTERIRLRSPEA